MWPWKRSRQWKWFIQLLIYVLGLKHYRRKNDQSVGFVPTMGYLHEGHASLLRKARSQSGLVVLSIFVNPLQFGPGEDFERYPRNTERDLQVAEAAGVDLVFMPSVSEMYPSPTRTTVSVIRKLPPDFAGRHDLVILMGSLLLLASCFILCSRIKPFLA